MFELEQSKLIKKYNNDYKQALKTDKTYNQENENFNDQPKTLKELHEQIKANSKGFQYLGYFTQYQGRDVIGIMENANASTLLHELAHSYLNALKTLSLTDEEVQKKYEAVKK